MGRKLLFCEPVLAEGTVEALADVVNRNFLNEGPAAARFEKAIADVCGTQFAVATTSGTVALTLSLLACGIGPGDEVIVPDFTYVATANAVSLIGARVVLVDIETTGLGIDPDAVEKAITNRTKAIMPVHVSGRAANMPAILEIARRHNLRVIEDAAEALGSFGYGKALGSFGDAGCFSFSPNKTISSGQGGMVVTNDSGIVRRLRELKNQGRVERGTGGADDHPTFGANFKLSDLQAVVALQQMPYLSERLERLRQHYRIYSRRLGNLPGIRVLPFDVESGACPQWVDIIVEGRDSLSEHLVQRDMMPRKMWFPVHTQLPYRADGAAFPVASALAVKGLWLPSSLNLSDSDVESVCDAVHEWSESSQLVSTK